MKTIIYPGHFNPITNGHIDLIDRALRLFDKVIVALGVSKQKNLKTGLEPRIELCKAVLQNYDRVEVDGFDNLLVNYARERGVRFILRGIRNAADFEYEFQMVNMNRMLVENIDYIFLTPSRNYADISSSLVREIAALGGDVSGFVPPLVNQALIQQYGTSNQASNQTPNKS